MQDPENCKDWDKKGEIPSLLEVIHNVKPTAILGLTGVSRAVAEYNQKPIIFPLSNPTSNVEAIPEDIFNWCSMINTGADAYPIIASGSPFPDVVTRGKSHIIGQGNNAFIFPGLGFACALGECEEITESLIIESAHALADYTAEHHLKDGRILSTNCRATSG
ncbi:NADP-dependent malic enzyme [Nymphon striatum]|nr:NADP-dependent malic enzyme [Nymphon striatum]